MKKLAMTVSALALGTALVFAAPHEGRGGHAGHGKQGARLEQKLNLTEAQKQQIAQIRESIRQENAAFFASAEKNREEMQAARKAGDTARAESLKATMKSQREQMKQIRETEKARISATLTPEQRQKFETMSERGGKRGDRHMAHRGMGEKGFHGQMAKKLNLTEDQQARIEAIRKETHEQNKALFDARRDLREQMREARETNDTARLESLKATAQSQRAQMKSVHEATMARIASVLTPEQRAKFDEMKSKHHGGMGEHRRN